MKTISVQQMPDGFEIEKPTFGYWFKVGCAFTLGAGVTSLVGAFLGWILVIGLFGGLMTLFHR